LVDYSERGIADMRGQMTKTLEVALKYREKGFSVIPIKPPEKDDKGEDKNKKPFIKWERFQNERPTEAQVREWFKKWPNARIAIVTGPISDIDVIDIDSKDGEDKLLEAVNNDPRVLNTAMAESPRGGKHLYFKASGQGNAVGFLEEVDYRGKGGYIIAPPSQGLNGKNSSWYPNASLFEIEPPAAPQPIINIINSLNRYAPTWEDENSKNAGDFNRLQVTSSDFKFFTKGHRDNTLFHLANHLIKGGMPAEEIEYYLSVIAAKLCDPPFPQKEIHVKINSAIKRAKIEKTNISEMVRDWVLTSSGFFLTSDCFKGLQLTSREMKKAGTLEFLRLKKKGVIEPYGEKNGCYRLVEKDFEEIEISKIGEGQSVNISLPFGIEQFVEIMPKDLIVYAGVPNSGKSALIFETIRLNQDKWKCYYFSTEMSRYNVKKRIRKHRACQDWYFKISDDIPNYYDILKPNDLNFIDYVEPSEGEYYKVASYLAGIQKRLKKGLAIVALQKPSGRDTAWGGEQTLNKPALYCSIDPLQTGNRIKLVKAKNYRDYSVRGFVQEFKIIDGINIIKDGTWLPEM
jgi:hypothetical protein